MRQNSIFVFADSKQVGRKLWTEWWQPFFAFLLLLISSHINFELRVTSPHTPAHLSPTHAHRPTHLHTTQMSRAKAPQNTSLCNTHALSKYSQTANSYDKLHQLNLTFLTYTCDAYILQALASTSFREVCIIFASEKWIYRIYWYIYISDARLRLACSSSLAALGIYLTKESIFLRC